MGTANFGVGREWKWVVSLLRMVSVRETAWLNTSPASIWAQLTDVEEWSQWCQGIRRSEFQRGLSFAPGTRIHLVWESPVPAPLQGGTISMIRDPAEIRVRQVGMVKMGMVKSYRRESYPFHQPDDSVRKGDSQIDCYQLAWFSGWGPWRSDACITLRSDGAGSRVEFLSTW